MDVKGIRDDSRVAKFRPDGLKGGNVLDKEFYQSNMEYTSVRQKKYRTLESLLSFCALVIARGAHLSHTCSTTPALRLLQLRSTSPNPLIFFLCCAGSHFKV